MKEKILQANKKKNFKELVAMILSLAFAHFCFLFFFKAVGVKEMFIFNIGSVIYFILLSIMPIFINIDPLLLDFLCCIELFSHQIASVYFVGLEPGFQYIFWGMISPLIGYSAKRTFKIFIAIKGACSAICFGATTLLFTYKYQPVYAINNTSAILACKIFIIYITFFIVSITTLHTYEKSQRKIKEEYTLYQKELDKKLETQQEIVKVIANIIEARDENTGQHTERTSMYVRGILDVLKTKTGYKEKLKNEYIDYIVSAATLHDIGKIKIPDTILNKPGKLNDNEYEIIKSHTVEGAKLIDMCKNSIENKDYLKIAREIALCHHERIDGKGYPNGLKDDEIPFSARVMAVADVYDALTSKRVYKEKYDRTLALNILESGRNTQFDGEILDAFLEYLKENPAI